MEMIGFSASMDRKSQSSGSWKTSSLKGVRATAPAKKPKTPAGKKPIQKENRKNGGVAAVHPKSAPVSRQPVVVDEVDAVKSQTQTSAVTKAIFTKLETKTKRKRRVKGVFGSVDVTSGSTARGKASQSSSEVDRGSDVKGKKKKKKKKGKKHKKSKKKKKVDKSILEYLKRDKNRESDTDDDDDDDDDDEENDADELNPYPMRRKMYRPHLGIPGQSFLRAELEDPITLVEEEFLPEGLQTLRLTRSQLAMNFLYNKPRTATKLKSTEKEPSEKSAKYDESRSKSAQESTISLDLVSSARSLAPSTTPNLLKTAPLNPKYNSVRFTIPMDVRVLQNLKPNDYLTSYCIPESYFQNICSRVFENKFQSEFTTTVEFLTASLNEIFGFDVDESHLQRIIDLIGVDEKITENLKLFTAYAAIFMRIQCREFGSNSEKDKIEKMDFYLLRLNLKSFPIDLQTNKLLQFIDSI